MDNKQKSNKTTDHVLPTEIIIEILLKLPVLSLLRCKSVCRSWYSLISDHHFIKTHYKLSSANINYEHHRLICNTHEERNNLISFPLSHMIFHICVDNALKLENPLQLTRPPGFKIVGCCNGLMCVCVEDEDYNLFIYNPSTRIWHRLPFRRRKGLLGSCTWYCFGYVESTDDYKVVEMFTNFLTKPKTNIKVKIYSLKTGNWKKLGDFAHDILCGDSGKFLNGALHWVAYKSLESSFARRIVFLDLEKETYGEVLQPVYDEGYTGLVLGVLGEWLCLVCNYPQGRADVWVMKVYGVKDSWTKLVTIRHHTSPISMPFCFSNDGKVLLRFGSKLVVYDCINSSYSEIKNFDGCREACIVVQSLVSPFPHMDLPDNSDDEN